MNSVIQISLILVVQCVGVIVGEASIMVGDSQLKLENRLFRLKRSFHGVETELNQTSRDILLASHNSFRRQVMSSNMKLLRWSNELHYSALKHAKRCTFRHSDMNERRAGENIWAATYADWSQATTLWYNEVYDQNCDCGNFYKPCCGHYTQMVWADTMFVGCALAYCDQGMDNAVYKHILICHYNPPGNLIQRSPDGTVHAISAYKRSTADKEACADCRYSNGCYHGLCY